VQRRERQFEFGLHTDDLGDATTGGLSRAVVQQRCLADPGLTADDQHSAFAATDTVQQAIERRALARAPAEGRHSWCGHPATVEPFAAREHPARQRLLPITGVKTRW
jgi:hypothetical protein